MWFCFSGNIFLNFGLCQVHKNTAIYSEGHQFLPSPKGLGRNFFFQCSSLVCTSDSSIAFHFLAASCASKIFLVLADALFHAVSWMVFILAQASLTLYFSKTHLYWWSRRKKAPETEPMIFQTGHSKLFAVGEHFQNICLCFGWLKGKRFQKCWVLGNWELYVFLPQSRQLKELWGRTILSIAKYS